MREGLLNFSKGELADELIARADVASYNAGLKKAFNVVVLKYGGVTKRPGTRLVAKAYGQADPVRLFPFQFSLTQAYALEFGQGYMRAAANGGLVVETPLKITAITKALNAQVTVAFHGYSPGQQIYFNDNVGMVEINGMTGTVQTVIDANNFTVDIDSRTFSTFVSSDGAVNTSPPAAPPAPPAVPAPVPPPTPPDLGGGGSYSDSGGRLHVGGGGGSLP